LPVGEESEDGSAPRGPSKTQRKKASDAQQALGELLVSIPEHELKKVPMDDDLKDAVILARSIRSHEGRRRQMQYIGKLMRQRDIEPIRVQLLDRDSLQRQETARMHAAELWRTRLLADASQLPVFCASYASAPDREPMAEMLQALITGAKAPPSDRQLKAFRDLYRRLHAAIVATEQAAAKPLAQPEAPPTL
jgi:ribosome-associated protein